MTLRKDITANHGGLREQYEGLRCAKITHLCMHRLRKEQASMRIGDAHTRGNNTTRKGMRIRGGRKTGTWK